MQSTLDNPKELLRSLLDAAIAAAHPDQCLAQALPADRSGRALVLGAGKAAGAMAAVFEREWQGPLSGLVVTRYGHGVDCERIEVLEASHPVPDTAGSQAAARMLSMASNLNETDTVFFLVSGGGSSLLSLPAQGIGLDEKKAINKALLASGAAIDEINCVRKHLSAIKGGRLALACGQAKLVTYAISDVPGDDPSVIASGPTVTDATTRRDARAVLDRYKIEYSTCIDGWLASPQSETPKPGDFEGLDHTYHMIATPSAALAAAAEAAKAAGLEVLVLGDNIEGEAREVARVMAGIATYIGTEQAFHRKPMVILSGGETTVTLRGQGRGGRNAEFLLALSTALKGAPNIYALAADTDGIDGTEDNAGAYFEPGHWLRAQAMDLSPRGYLDNNDGYGYFNALNALIKTGPTRTNVNDFRAVLVL